MDSKGTYLGSWRTACCICGQLPKGLSPAGNGGNGCPLRGAWVKGPPPKPAKNHVQLTDQLVAVYARMLAPDFERISSDWAPKQVARLVARRAFDAGAPVSTAKAAMQATDSLRQQVEQAQSRYDKSQEAAVKAMQAHGHLSQPA